MTVFLSLCCKKTKFVPSCTSLGSKSSHLCSFVSKVKYWRNQEDSEGGAMRVVVPGTENQTRLEGMKPNSDYLIEVRGFNSAGYGPPSKHLQIHTKKARMLMYKSSLVLTRTMYCSCVQIWVILILIFLSLIPAPSRAPKIIGKKLKGQSVNIAWEHVEPLANEASVDGYKVSTVKHLWRLLYLTFSLWSETLRSF